jgi:hypothetical protein
MRNRITRSMLLLKRSEQNHFYNAERQQINKARQEAEALFRSKPECVKPSAPTEQPVTESSARKPRILSASMPSINRAIAEASMSSKPQTKHEISALQLAHVHRARLSSARDAIFKQQSALQAKLDAINSELRAIDAYEAAKNSRSSLGSIVPDRPCGVTIY